MDIGHRANWREIQTVLKRLGFYAGRIDGIRGPLTDGAIVAFKRSIGFLARPLYGELTHAALMKRVRPDSRYPWLDAAWAVLGLHEVRDHSRLRAWFDRSVQWISPREIAWCGAFVATAVRKWDPDVKLPENPLGARQWGAFGKSCRPQVGAIMTFTRPGPSWAGHVGFVVGEDATCYHILGGNQSDAVTVARILKSRLLQTRWPSGHPEANERLPFGTVSASISHNES